MRLSGSMTCDTCGMQMHSTGRVDAIGKPTRPSFSMCTPCKVASLKPKVEIGDNRITCAKKRLKHENKCHRSFDKWSNQKKHVQTKDRCIKKIGNTVFLGKNCTRGESSKEGKRIGKKKQNFICKQIYGSIWWSVSKYNMYNNTTTNNNKLKKW